MALSERARKMTVGGERYRWLVTETDRWLENASPWPRVLEARALTLVVQREGGGQKLIAAVPAYTSAIRERDVVTSSADGRVRFGSIPRQETSVTPALVARLIERALAAGWRPAVNGADFVLDEATIRSLLGAAQ